MIRLFATRKAAICALGAAAATISMSVGTVTAQAQSGPTCNVHTICVWQGVDYSGQEVVITPSAFSGEWYRFDAVAGWNPGSLINNSGSLIWTYDATPPTKGPWCYPGDQDLEVSLNGLYGHFYIKYNSPHCPSNSDYPKPLPG
jgi:hypothetical protein